MKIREIIQTLFPTKTWKLAAIIAGGVLCGLGSYTLYASRAWTYLSDDPATCVNCHIMGPYYATWNHSSHSRNATCNDCHVPHENAVINYFANGSKSYAKERVEVFSQERVLVLDNWRKLTGYGFKGFSSMKAGMDKGQKRQFTLLNERIREGGESLIPFEGILNTTKATFACITSLKERCWVNL